MADKEKPAKAAGAPKDGAPQKAKSPRGEKKAAASKEPRQPAAPRPKDYKPRMKSHY
jgi:large subunit ribosomal protein L5